MDSDRWPEVRHVLSVDQFDRAFLEAICALTHQIREQCDTRDGARLLKGQFPNRRAMLYFTQPSTRTFLSFKSACQNLGADVVEVQNPDTSSEVKGESKLDAIRTFASYAHVIVMRAPEAGLAREAAEHLDRTPRPRPVVNAGSAADEHPTQALLDVYTLQRSFKDRGGIDGKTIALVGDLKRGRTVRSLARLMRHYHDMTLLLVSPPAFRMKQDVLDELDAHHIRTEVVDDLREAVRRADAVYMTRVQDEHDVAGESAQVSLDGFRFTPEHLTLLRPDGIVMHPLPRRDELDPACDRDERVKIWRQERNGMWVRTALLACIFATQQKQRKQRRR